MAKMKKVLAVVLALALVFSVATTSASALGSNNGDKGSSLFSKIFGSDKDKTPTLPSVKSVIENVKKSLDGTGLRYGRDYDVKVESDSVYGYRVHIIDPLTGKTLCDNYLAYDAGQGKWIWHNDWALPELPTSLPSIKDVANNIYTALYDSGIIFEQDFKVDVKRTSQDGYDILIINPLTGKVVYEKHVLNENINEFSKEVKFSWDAAGGILSGHLPEEETSEPATDAPTTPATTEEQVTVAVDDKTPQANVVEAVPMAPVEKVAQTGDNAAVAAVVALSVVAGAAFVAAKKH